MALKSVGNLNAKDAGLRRARVKAGQPNEKSSVLEGLKKQ